MQEAARSRYNDVLDFDSSSTILKIEWREEGLGFTAHVQPFLSPVSPHPISILLVMEAIGSCARRGVKRTKLVKQLKLLLVLS